jgi:hypothetical protein
MTQTLWRQVQALVHSSRGQHIEAELLAREAVDIALQGDSLVAHGDAFFYLGEVLEASGCRGEAAAALRESLDNYERKRDIPLARRTRERLAALQETPT